MPFSTGNVDQYNKGLSAKQKKIWVATANSVYTACMKKGGSDKSCAPKAIRIANGVVKKSAKENSNILRENVILDLSEAQFDTKDKIKNARIIAKGWSLNDRYYSKEALGTLVPFLKENRLMFLNHRDISEGRDLRDWMSKLDPPTIKQNEIGDIYSDIIMTSGAEPERLLTEIKKDPTALGLSICAFAMSHQGNVDGKDGAVIDEFVGCHSVDWVYNPGAKGGFDSAMFEAFNVPANSEEGLEKMEELELRKFGIEQINEDFEYNYFMNILYRIGMWLTDYLYYDVLMNNGMTREDKQTEVETALDFFKAEVMKIIQNENVLNNLDNLGDDSQVIDGSENKTSKSNLTESIRIAIERLENDSYNDLQEYKKDVIYYIENRKVKFINTEELSDMDMKEFQKNHPEIHQLLLAEATTAAFSQFKDELDKKVKELETITGKVSESGQKVADLAKEIEDLKAKVTEKDTVLATTQEKLKKFEDEEKVNKEKADKTAREALIDKVCTEIKFEKKDIPEKMLEKLMNITLMPEDEVSDFIKMFAGVRERENKNIGLKPEDTKENEKPNDKPVEVNVSFMQK